MNTKHTTSLKRDDEGDNCSDYDGDMVISIMVMMMLRKIDMIVVMVGDGKNVTHEEEN